MGFTSSDRIIRSMKLEVSSTIRNSTTPHERALL